MNLANQFCTLLLKGRPYRWSVVFFLAGAIMDCADAGSYLLPSPPSFPTSYEECKTILEEYHSASRELYAQADQIAKQADQRHAAEGYAIAPKWWIDAYKRVSQLQNEGSRLSSEGARLRDECNAKVRTAQQEEQRRRDAEEKADAEAKARQQAQQSSWTHPRPSLDNLTNTPGSDLNKAYDKSNPRKIYEGTKPYAKQQLSVPDKDAQRLLNAQIANIAITTMTSAMMSNVRNARNPNVDEVASFGHDRVAQMRDIINEAQGTNPIVQGIQKESFDELKRQHNQILGDLENIRRTSEQFDSGKIAATGLSGSGSSPRWNPPPSVQPQDSQQSDETAANQDESTSTYANPESTESGESNDSTSSTDYESHVSSDLLKDYTHSDEVDTSSSSHGTVTHLANAGETPVRPAGACNYFSRQSDVEQYWHVEGARVCNASIMYRCESGVWQRLGKCQGFSNWRNNTVEQLEKTH